ncbi:putative GTPase activating protein for Arf-domain-containing protein [Powellomyces hirtus]|nr:putative GTPase activating protein for Arf-domain-containing protein [Powellomyces hirtus]
MSSQLTEREKKKRDEQNVKVLQELLALPENQSCADCGERGPRWASTNLGCFLCIRCGGLHRKLGTHISKIKSVTLDSWSPEQLEVMRQWGNQKVNEKFLAGGAPAPPSNSDQEMEQYVRNKYEKRNFEKEGGASRTSNANFSRDANAYATQIRTLRGMGFEDDQRNISCLKRANGNVATAIELLVAMPQSASSQQSSPARSNAAKPSQPNSQSPAALAQNNSNAQSGRYPAVQTALAALRAMGFNNDEENLQALNASGGQLENAANRLLDAKNRREGQNAGGQGFSNNSAPVIPARNDSAATGFVLEPPSSSNRGQRGAARQQPGQQQQQAEQAAQPAQAKSNDPFGLEADFFSAAQPAQPSANQQSNQGSNDLASFGAAAPTAVSAAKGANKDNIMSLFNSPRQNQMSGFGNMPQQQQFGGGQAGFPGGGQHGGMYNQFGGSMPNQQGGQQQFGGAGMGMNPFTSQNQGQQQQMTPQQQQQYLQQMQMQQQQQMMQQQQMLRQQPAYTYGASQANPFDQSSLQPRAAQNSGQSGFGQQPFGQQQQQQQPQQQQQERTADPFADLGPSFGGARAVAQGQGQGTPKQQPSSFF